MLLDNAAGVPGSAWQNEDGSYSIFIDASLCLKKQQEVFIHEICHILNLDFEKFDVNEIEKAAHSTELYSELRPVI